MKVGIKIAALLLYLILVAKAVPKGNGKAGGGENEGAEAGDAGQQGEADEAGDHGEMEEEGEQGEVGEAGEQGEVGEAGEMGEMGEEQGLAEGGEVGEEGENAVTVKLPTDIVKSQTPRAMTPANEEPEATSFVTEDDTTKQRPEVAPYTPDTRTTPFVTLNDFNYLDRNGDGFLDYTELFFYQNNFNPEHLNAAFQISDENADGVVDQLEYFRHPVSWGAFIAEKQSFSTSGPDASETLTSQRDVTATAEQTYTASPDVTSHSLPKDNVTTPVPSAEQSTTDLTAVDHQPSGPTDTSTRAHINVVDQANGGQSVAVPKVAQGQKDVANGKAGSQVASKAGVRTGLMIGHQTGGMAGYRRLGTGVVSNGDQPIASKRRAVASSTGDQAGIATGQKDQKRTGAGSYGSQPGDIPGSVGGHGQRGGDGIKNGKAGFAGSAGRHAVTVTGKVGGHAMSHGVQHRITTGTHTTGVQSGLSVHPGGKIHGRIVVHSYLQTAPVSWPVKAQAHAKPQYHRWVGQKWVKADVEQGVPYEMGSSDYGKSKVSEYNRIAKSAGMETKYFPDE